MERTKDLLERLKKKSVKYNPVGFLKKKTNETEVINTLCGGDMTTGSCASVGLAYIGQMQGWDVRDFRGGDSMNFFSSAYNLSKLSWAGGLKTIRATGKTDLTVGSRLLKNCENGKRYYLCVGRHASIIRKTDDGILEYLELQSARNSGWNRFNKDPKITLRQRFGCSTRSSPMSEDWDFMLDLQESSFDTDEFRSLLGYINTNAGEEMKGVAGTIK